MSYTKEDAEKLLKLALAAEAVDITRHTLTGKGKSWLPNSLAKKQGIKNPSLKTWWGSGKSPFGLKGSFLGARPTSGGVLGLAAMAGMGGYEAGKALTKSDFGDYIGLGEEDLKGYGKSLYHYLNKKE